MSDGFEPDLVPDLGFSLGLDAGAVVDFGAGFFASDFFASDFLEDADVGEEEEFEVDAVFLDGVTRPPEPRP